MADFVQTFMEMRGGAVAADGKAKGDLVGKRFGRWLTLSRSHADAAGSVFLCRCDCGNEGFVGRQNLRSGVSRSCGCLLREWTSAKNFKHGHAARGAVSYEHQLWSRIKRRCLCKNSPSFYKYGGRGITVFPAWIDNFEEFLSYVGKWKGYTLDRIDNNRGYEPGNVRWATAEEQARNTRRNRWIEMNGQTKTLVEWSQITGINVSSILARMKSGWSIERALTEPINTKFSHPTSRKDL